MINVQFNKSRRTKAETKSFEDLAAASAFYSKRRDASGEGASSFPDASVKLADGSDAYIAYNGKVFGGATSSRDWKPGIECLYNPYA